MERVEAECQECGRIHQVRTEFIGRRIKCKGCGEPLVVPDPEDEPEDLPPRRPSVRKKKRKKSKDQDAFSAAYDGATREYSTMKIIVLVLIAVTTLRFAQRAFYVTFLFRIGVGAGITTIASWIATIALAVGGVGIFQKEDWGDGVTQMGALGMLAAVAIGLVFTVPDFLTNPRSFVTLPGLIANIAIGCAIPATILYCMYRSDWDE